MASLFQRQQKLESDLNSKAPAAGREEASERRERQHPNPNPNPNPNPIHIPNPLPLPLTDPRRERQHLVQLVKIQAKEVEALKLEIKMLRRKGGHVYSAPVPA